MKNMNDRLYDTLVDLLDAFENYDYRLDCLGEDPDTASSRAARKDLIAAACEAAQAFAEYKTSEEVSHG